MQKVFENSFFEMREIGVTVFGTPIMKILCIYDKESQEYVKGYYLACEIELAKQWMSDLTHERQVAKGEIPMR